MHIINNLADALRRVAILQDIELRCANCAKLTDPRMACCAAFQRDVCFMRIMAADARIEAFDMGKLTSVIAVFVLIPSAHGSAQLG